ncbi:MAG TPA: DUF1559 domain-containing protein [Isosphaeraceae bacterium]|jgi:prepilin-type N-terminal cleavage/methylation domain-containing protein/prepilin-type processing-associated H-X9-DG protein|nr:DUF1559 domain-containing protein [Isosphaeraceae bacterium]
MNRPRSKPARAAFTLIELLVVLAIIGVLIALLLPAVQMSREAARRIQCCNNLMQIGLALQGYESSHNVFPPGVVDVGNGPLSNTPTGYHFGWFVRVLPYLEQKNLFHSFNFDVSVYNSENMTARSMHFTFLSCPTDYAPFQANAASPSGAEWMTNYAACHHDVEAPIAADNHGVFFLNSHVRLEDIDDGASNTIFAGERVKKDVTLGWSSGTRATLRNTGTPVNAGLVRSLSVPMPPPPSAAYVGGFGSYHAGGANFLLGDGSVRFLKSGVSGRMYQLLGHRDDGEVVDPGWF